jgi:hypothetical protein
MRNALFVAALLLATLLGGAGRSAAQDAARVGVVTGYPATVGILWRASDRVSIRPEFSFQGQWSDATTAPSQGTTETSSGSGAATYVGASVLLYVGGRDGLRPYFSPRFLYGRNSSSATSDQLSASTELTGDSYSLTGSLGAEYALGRRFAVFGELGIAYSHTASRTTYTGSTGVSSKSTGDGDSFGTRTAVGVIYFF